MNERYVAVIRASKIWKYEVEFFDGPPVASLGNSEKYGWENQVKSSGHGTLWGANRAARRGLKHLNRMGILNKRLDKTP